MAHYNLALALNTRGRIDEAIDHFQRTLEIDSGCVQAHSNLGVLLSRCGRIDEAIAQFQEALKLDPSNASVRNNLEKTLKMRSDRTEKAQSLVPGQTRIDGRQSAFSEGGSDMSARRRKKDKRAVSNPPAARSQAAGARKPRRPLSRRRKWLFRLTAMIVAPVLFFAVLEAGLRLGGYGYPTAFFVGPDADGIYTPNPRFGWRFFPRAIARKPEPCFISAKPAGAVRIFVLGSSAAQGVPNPSFSFGRILEVMLRERYPDVKFEVVNAAMTAINSHVALEIARDCAAHQPDLFVVYMGNNEVIGPYGPGTVFQQWSPSRRLIRANVWLKSTRVGQLLGDAMGWLHSAQGFSSGVARHGDVSGQSGGGRRPAADGGLRQLSAEPDRYLRHRPACRGRRDPFDGGREPQRLPAAGLAAPIGLVGRGVGEVGVALSGRHRTGKQREVAGGNRQV